MKVDEALPRPATYANIDFSDHVQFDQITFAR
ncbi:hypothetical protein BH09VER1_BH09VER1_15690 [soil metagenome]